MTRAERIDGDQLLASPALLSDVARRITAGAVFVYPTETIYGVGGRADSDDVRARIHAVKGRAEGNPLIVVASTRDGLESLGVRFGAEAESLAAALWPGPLTMVLPCGDQGGCLGVRVCTHPVVNALQEYGAPPLFSTSANRSGATYDGDPDTLYEIFAGNVDFMVDIGRIDPSPPSSVVRPVPGGVEVLREGAVTVGRLREVPGIATVVAPDVPQT